MKLLVLAQTPPPLHGQSLMVQTMLEALPDHGIAVHHVPLNLSRDHADIGRWRPGKIFTVLTACLRAVTARFTQPCDTLYYVPAPGKRGALYRDWTVMLLCRPFYRRLVLHFHNGGLGDWLRTRATMPERWLTRFLLGRANLAIVLTESMRPDGAALHARQIAVVPNGIADPGPSERLSARTAPYQVFFLGLCSAEKGLFVTAEAVLAANRAVRALKAEPRFILVAAGAFPDFATGARFRELCTAHPATIQYAGLVQGDEKARLLGASHCLCLPSHYQPEGQPLVLLEAMAFDLPTIASRWRGIPDTLPPDAILVEPDDPEAIANALVRWRKNPPPAGVFRRHYLANFTVEKHLATLAGALRDGLG